MSGDRLTITLLKGQRKELDQLVSAINEGRAEPVKLAHVVRVALKKLLDENRTNPIEIARQFRLPFDQG